MSFSTLPRALRSASRAWVWALVACLAIGSSALAQTTILQESFETDGDGTRYSTSFTFNDGTNDHYGRTDGSDISTVLGSYAGADGSFYIAGEDLDDGGGDGLDEKTLTISSIDISGFSNLSFTGLFAFGSQSGWDRDDLLYVEYSIDGGPFTKILQFTSGGFPDDFNEPVRQDFDFDGTVDGTEPALDNNFVEYTAAIAGTGSTLTLRFFCDADSGSEEFAFDNLRIQGDGGTTGPVGPVYTAIAAVDFGAVEVGTTSTLPASVTNSGDEALVIELAGVTGLGFNDFTTDPTDLNGAKIDGAQANAGAGTGSAGTGWFKFEKSGNDLIIEGAYEGLQGDLTVHHIHYGARGSNGGVAANLDSYHTAIDTRSGTYSGTITGFADAGGPDPGFAALDAKGLYVNIHSTLVPAGEIRGQIGEAIVVLPTETESVDITYAPQAATSADALLDLSTNDPSNLTTSIGLAGNGFVPAPTFNAPDGFAVDFGAVLVGATSTQAISIENTGTDLLIAELGDATGSDDFAVDLSTVNGSSIDGAQANAGIGTGSTGTGWAQYTVDGTTMSVSGAFEGLSGDFTIAHVHQAAPDANGGVTFGLTVTLNSDNRSGTFTGSGTIDPAVLAAGEYYINIHSAFATGGEIRGQIGNAVVLQADESTSFDVDFTPSTDGLSVATLTLSTNDMGNPSPVLDFSGTGLTPPAPVASLVNDFSTDPFTEGWQQYSLAGDQEEWQYFSGSGVVNMNGFIGGGCETSDDWLITPALDFDANTNNALTFDLAHAFGDNPVVVLFSSAYPGAGAPNPMNWTVVSTIADPGANGTVNVALTTELASLSGTGYLAFRYEDADGACTSWTLDNFAFQGSTPVVRFLEINPDTEEITLKNFGTASADVSGYFLCLGPGQYNGLNDAGYGLNGGDLTLDANETLTISLSGGVGSISDLTGTGGLGLFTQSGAFASTDPSVFIDYAQWGAANQDRSAQAVTTGIWDDAANFIDGNAPYNFNGTAVDFGSMFWSAAPIVINPGDVVISEIMYDSEGTDEEWIELYNTTMSAIDISGFYVSDDDAYPATGEGDFVIPDGTMLMPGQAQVFSWDGAPLTGIASIEVDASTGARSSGPTLGNSGDNIYLYSAMMNGTLVDGSLTDNYPDKSSGNVGNSIERFDLTAANFGLADSWLESIVPYVETIHVNCTPNTYSTPAVPVDLDVVADVVLASEAEQTVVTVTVTANQALTENLFFDYAPTLTSTAGLSDYMGAGFGEILTGETTGTFSFTIADDMMVDEGPETLDIEIFVNSPYRVVSNQAQITILDNDYAAVDEQLSGSAFRADVRSKWYDAASVSYQQLSYDAARSAMFGSVNNVDGFVEGIYTGYTEAMTFQTVGDFMNTEHIVPQSTFSETLPMRSDLHHLAPSHQSANTRRSNYPFANIENADLWLGIDGTGTYQELSNEPANASAFSEVSTSGTVNTFEPRDEVKGDVARAVFYFFTMYESNTDLTATIDDLAVDLTTLYEWHVNDPVDAFETDRHNRAQLAQYNRNPFIDNPEWVLLAFPEANPVDLPAVTLGGLNFANLATGEIGSSITLTDNGGGNITEFGFVWSTSPEPTLETGTKEMHPNGNPALDLTYNYKVTGLPVGNMIYIRAYAINEAGVAYSTGELVNAFGDAPAVAAPSLNFINTGQSRAGFAITVTDLGDFPVTEYGLAWSTSPNPTTSDNVTQVLASPPVGTPVNRAITGLPTVQLVYVRAYAINAAGTVYSSVDEVIGLGAAPTVADPSLRFVDLDNALASVNLLVSSEGDFPVEEYGLVWSTTSGPTLNDNISTYGGFSAGQTLARQLTDLPVGQAVFVRAFATNATGTTLSAGQVRVDLGEAPTVEISLSGVDGPSQTADFSLTVTGDGQAAGGIIEAGLVYSTTDPFPTAVDDVVMLGMLPSINAPANAQISNFPLDQQVFVAAYARNSLGIYGYSEAVPVAIAGLPVASITQNYLNARAQRAGFDLQIDNSALPNVPVREFGVVWGNSPNPTTNDNVATRGFFDPMPTSVFTRGIGELPIGAQDLYFRAYAITAAGTAYSANEIFLPAGVAPTVSMVSNTFYNASTNQAGFEATVDNDGGTQVFTVGVVWATSPNPTLEDNVMLANANFPTGTTFGRTINGLPASGTVYVRAFATNGAGTSYSPNEIELMLGSGTQAGSDIAADFEGELESDLNMSLYPNPASGRLNVTLYGADSGTLTLYDAAGRVAGTFEVQAGQRQLDVSTLKRGLYLIRLDSKAGSLTERIIIE